MLIFEDLLTDAGSLILNKASRFLDGHEVNVSD